MKDSHSKTLPTCPPKNEGIDATQRASHPPLALFASTTGVKDWRCPACRQLNRTRVQARNGWRVQCRAAYCQRVWIVGEVFYEAPPGHKVLPPDVIMPLDYETGPWRSSQPVNRIVCSDCAKIIQEEPRAPASRQPHASPSQDLPLSKASNAGRPVNRLRQLRPDGTWEEL